MDFYIVSDEYLRYLRYECGFSNIMLTPGSIDPDKHTVRYNHDKFVLGVIINVNGINYYAPVSSLNHKDFGTSSSKEGYLAISDDKSLDTTKLRGIYNRKLFPIRNIWYGNDDIISFLRTCLELN